MPNPKDLFNKAYNLMDANGIENSNLDYYEIIHSNEGRQFYSDPTKDVSIFEQAIALLNEYLAISPNCKYAHSMLGFVYYILNDYENSILNFSKTISIDENYYKAHYYLGILNNKFENYKEALGNFTRAITINPNYSDSYLNRGHAYINLANYSEAINDYTLYISKEENYFQAYQYRGLCFLFQKKYKKAIDDFTKVILLKPSYVSAYRNRGVCYLECDDYENAIQDFNKAIELGFSDEHVLKGLNEAQKKLEGLSKPDKKPQIIQAICEMNIVALESLLDDFRTYQEATKEVFLGKLNEIFERFREDKDTRLNAFAGSCNSKECDNNFGCSGLAFVGNVSNNALNLILKESENNFIDIFDCSKFKINNKNVKPIDNYEIDIKRDEEAKFSPFPERAEMFNKCKTAYNEIVNPSIDLLTKNKISNWLNKHAEFHSTIGYNAGVYASAFNFYNLFRLLKSIETHISFEVQSKNAIEEFNTIDKSEDSELQKWLLKYENLEEEIVKLELSFKDNGEIKYRKNQKRFNIKIDLNEIQYGLQFSKIFDKYYLKISRK
jgi:tetratricopeptide (TPR) repeat protein